MKPVSRRKFVVDALKVSAMTAVGTPLLLKSTDGFAHPVALQFSQIALPYGYTALEPSIDAMTMEIHYSKHHAAYVKNVNDAITAENISFGTEADFFLNASKLKLRKSAIFILSRLLITTWSKPSRVRETQMD